MAIEFTQFILPHGRREQVHIERPGGIEEMADKLIQAGCHFETELLSTGMVNMDCQDQNDELIAMELCTNSPVANAEAVDKLVTQAYADFFGPKLYLQRE